MRSPTSPKCLRRAARQTRITLQFDLNRDIDGAARDVQAAINAARADLRRSLRSNPIYRKINPGRRADLDPRAHLENAFARRRFTTRPATFSNSVCRNSTASARSSIGGAALPAVRVELNPTALFNYGIGLEDVRAALAAANANSPKGAIEDGGLALSDLHQRSGVAAADYRPLIVGYRNGNAVHLSDLGEIDDSVEDLRNEGLSNGQPSVLVILFRQPGANIIDTVDRVKAELPALEAAMPSDVKITAAIDRSLTIRASLHDTERTLVIAVVLVTIIVFIFLGNPRAAVIPAIAVPVSIIGTFGIMYLMGFSLDNLSLMALTIATGFVVDDAIVVLENISRYVEAGVPRFQAALRGAGEVGFTVLSISLSLIAVFTPILLMSGLLGRLFREFALTLSIAILVSLAISLTTTPMLCSLILKAPAQRAERRRRWHPFTRVLEFYERTLGWALRNTAIVMLALFGAMALTVFLFVVIPKGFFPQQDTGRLIGAIQADQSISFQAMQRKMTQLMAIVQADPAVNNVVGFTGGGSGGGRSSTNTGSVFVSLKPLSQRTASADEVINRLRRKLGAIPGAHLFLQSVQDISVGGRQGNAQFQYTLQGDTPEELNQWTPNSSWHCRRARF